MREVINFNENWEFSEDGQIWKQIKIPHCFDEFLNLDEENVTYKKGLFRYRKFFEVLAPISDAIFIEFNGVNSSCEVFVNSCFVGKHQGGYSVFRFDITKYLVETKKNIVEVWVDNRINENVYPLDADFNSRQ